MSRIEDMKKIVVLISLLILIVPSSLIAQWNPLAGEGEDEQPVLEEAAPQEKTEDIPDKTLKEVEAKDIDIEDVLPEEQLPDEEIPDEASPITSVDKDAETEGPMKITIDAIIYVDYQFFTTPDAFKIKYHINMGGTANLATSFIGGDAEIATEVTGYLAKWTTGQCILDVKIAKIPYEINYNKIGGKADINITFKKDIDEIWESKCTFLGGTGKPLISQGPPERWIGTALERTSPPLTSLVAPVDYNTTTSTTFEIAEYDIVEENLGSAKVKGAGLITIEPAKKPRAFLRGPAHAEPITQ